MRRTCGGSRPASTPATVSCCSAELRPRMISRDRSTKPSQLPSKGLPASGGGGGEGEGGVGQERRLLCRRRAVAEGGGGGGELAALPVPRSLSSCLDMTEEKYHSIARSKMLSL